MPQSSLSALLAIHLAAFLFGLVGLFGVLAQTDPLLITFGRALFAFIALGLFIRLQNTAPVRLTPRQRGLLALCGLLLALHWLAFFYAVKIASVAIAVLGFATFPLFALLLESLLLKRLPGAAQWLSLLLVLFGMLLVTPQFSLADSGSRGLLWAIASGFMFAVLSIATRSYLQGIEPTRATFSMTLVTCFCLLPFSASLLPTLKPLNWLWIALLGLLCTALAHSLIVYSLQRINAATVSVILALEAVYAIAAASLFLNERPTPLELFGGLLIISASVLISHPRFSS